MQTAKQLSVFLVNKPGRLAAMMTAMSKEKVNFRALSVMDSGDRGTIRFVPEDLEMATKVLQSLNVPYDAADVLMIEVPSQTGAFRNICEKLAAEHLNIDYAYCSLPLARHQDGSFCGGEGQRFGEGQRVLGETGSTVSRTPRRPGRRPAYAR